MCANQDNLILQLWIRAWDLGNHIVYLRVVREAVLDLQLHFHLLAPLQQASHTAVILDRQDNLRSRLRISLLVLHAT